MSGVVDGTPLTGSRRSLSLDWPGAGLEFGRGSPSLSLTGSILGRGLPLLTLTASILGRVLQYEGTVPMRDSRRCVTWPNVLRRKESRFKVSDRDGVQSLSFEHLQPQPQRATASAQTVFSWCAALVFRRAWKDAATAQSSVSMRPCMTTSAPSRSCSSDTRRPIVKSMTFKKTYDVTAVHATMAKMPSNWTPRR